MKITKLKTMMGEAESLTAVEMEKIVERMRSETTKKMAEVIREEALLGRMQMNQGGASGAQRPPAVPYLWSHVRQERLR